MPCLEKHLRARKRSAKPTARPVELHSDLYREIFAHSKEAIAIIDPDGFYLQQNGAHFTLLGYADDDLEGSELPLFYLGEEPFQRIFKQLLRTGEYSGEAVCRTRSGEERNIELSVFTMRSGLGEPQCYVSIKRDITARKKTEQELAQLLVRERTARADAEKANRLKDEFLATLSHELRTPLNAVIGWSRILKSGRLDNESSVHAIDVIERNAWAQKQIIEDILDVSRVITGKLQLHLGPVNLVSVVNAALDAVRPALEAKDIRVETEFSGGSQSYCGRCRSAATGSLESSFERFQIYSGQEEPLEFVLARMKPMRRSRYAIQAQASLPSFYRTCLNVSGRRMDRQRARMVGWDWDSQLCGIWLSCMVG